MDPSGQTTGTRDEHYNLISVIYHALHGAENCNAYALDTELAGEKELAAFFREGGRRRRSLPNGRKGCWALERAPRQERIRPLLASSRRGA